MRVHVIKTLPILCIAWHNHATYYIFTVQKWANVCVQPFYHQKRAKNITSKTLTGRLLIHMVCSPLLPHIHLYVVESIISNAILPVIPLLDRPMDLRRFEELDTSKDVVVPA